MSTPKPLDTKLSKEEVESLDGLQAVEKSVQSITDDLDIWLDSHGNNQPAATLFWKYLKPETQKEFLELIEELLPKSTWAHTKLETFNIDKFMKDPNGGQSTIFKESLLALKKVNEQMLEKLQQDGKSLHQDKFLQSKVSFVSFFSDTRTQYMHNGHHILETKESQEADGAIEIRDNRDQICINALIAFRDNNRELTGTDISLLDSEPFINILGELISQYALWKKKIEDNKKKLTDQLSIEEMNWFIQDRQIKIAKELEILLTNLCMKYSNDKDLLNIAYRLQKEVLMQLEPTVISTDSVVLSERKLPEDRPAITEKLNIDDAIKKQIAYLESLKTLQKLEKNQKFIGNIIKEYYQCIAQYQALSRNSSPNDQKIKILLEINKKYIIFTSKLNEKLNNKVQFFCPKTLEELNVSATKNEEPFEGYTKIEEKAEAGKQEKSEHAGFYISNTDGKKYFIKKSRDFQADDIAERLTSMLLSAVIGEQTVPYNTLSTKMNPKVIYLISEVSHNFETLQKKTLTGMYQLPDWRVGADLRTEPNKRKVFEALTTPEQKKGMARILAACLWVKNNDCQINNILVDDELSIKVFDFGWGLANICQPEHAQVKLFESILPTNTDYVGTHPPYSPFTNRKYVPTNHFNDYPDIINSQDFVDGLEQTLQEVDSAKIDEKVEYIINTVTNDYKNMGERETLTLFAKHIRLLENDQTFDNTIDNKAIKEKIKVALTKALQQRADSMAVLKCMMQIKVDLNENPQNADKILKHVSELQSVIQDKLKNHKLSAQQVIPPFEPSFNNLMQKAYDVMSNVAIDPQKSNEEHLKYLEFLLEIKEKATYLKRKLSSETSTFTSIEPFAANKIKTCINNRIKYIFQNAKSDAKLLKQYQALKEAQELLEDYKDKFKKLLNLPLFEQRIEEIKRKKEKIAIDAINELKAQLDTPVKLAQSNTDYFTYLKRLEKLQKEAEEFEISAISQKECYEFEKIKNLTRIKMEELIKNRIRDIIDNIPEEGTSLEKYKALENAKKSLKNFEKILREIHDNPSAFFKESLVNIQKKQILILSGEVGLLKKKLMPSSALSLKNQDIADGLLLLSLMDDELKRESDQTLVQEIEKTIDNLKSLQIVRLYITEQIRDALAARINPAIKNMELISHLRLLNSLEKDLQITMAEIEKNSGLTPASKKRRVRGLKNYSDKMAIKAKALIEKAIENYHLPEPQNNNSIEAYEALNKAKIDLNKFREQVSFFQEKEYFNAVFESKMQAIKEKKKAIIDMEVRSLQERLKSDFPQIIQDKDIEQAKELYKLMLPDKLETDDLEEKIMLAQIHKHEHAIALESKLNEAIKLDEALLQMANDLNIKKGSRKKDVEFLKKTISSISRENNNMYSPQKKMQILHGIILTLQEKMIPTRTSIGMNDFQKLLANTKSRLDSVVSADMFKCDPDAGEVYKANFIDYLDKLQTEHPNDYKKYGLVSKILEPPSSRSSLIAYSTFRRKKLSEQTNSGPKNIGKPEIL